ncbi:S-methyl thiohydantoin desulfurase domain-containing protein [Streptomyces sp. NPDC002125]
MTPHPSSPGPAPHRLSADQVGDLAAGATLLGSGGGGEVGTGALLLRRLLAGAPLPYVPAAALPPGALVVHVGLVGAPDVLAERLVNPDDFAAAVRTAAEAAGAPAGAVGVLEIGGLNAVVAALAACRTGLPLVDGDLMGRAFPRIDQTVAALHGLAPQPLVLVGPGGDTVVVPRCSPRLAEPLLRANVLALGGAAAMAVHPVEAGRLARIGVGGSVSACLELGGRFRAAVEDPGLTPQGLAAALGGDLLAAGRAEEIVPRHGQLPGTVTLIDRGSGAVVRVDLLDEFLAVTVDGVVRAASPQIIAAVDPSGRHTLRSDQIRTGQDLTLVRLPALYDWPDAGAALVGPAAFGLDLDMEPPRPRGHADAGRGR